MYTCRIRETHWINGIRKSAYHLHTSKIKNTEKHIQPKQCKESSFYSTAKVFCMILGPFIFNSESNQAHQGLRVFSETNPAERYHQGHADFWMGIQRKFKYMILFKM